MPISDLLTRSCSILRRKPSGETDEYGDEVVAVTVESTVCEVQQRQRDEPATEGDLSDTGWLGVSPAGTELRTADAIEVNGIGTLELIGDPWPVRDPETGETSHIEATLRVTAGGNEAA